MTYTVGDPDEAAAALASPDLVPPPPPPDLRPGPTRDLRVAMARFSSGPAHAARRADVTAAIAALRPDAVRTHAADRTRRALGPGVDVAAVAAHVPVAALLDGLGAGDEAGWAVDDVRQVVEVIGRGEPSSTASDDAATRLLRRFPVPVVSLLYQSHDATAALLTATLAARAARGPRRSAVARTVRVAERTTTVGQRPVAAGDQVVVDLDASGLEFGSGPHRCPGREVAEAIVAGILDVLDPAANAGETSETSETGGVSEIGETSETGEAGDAGGVSPRRR